jgi:hypothetical protein
MAIYAEVSGPIEQPPEGTHEAVVAQIQDLGLQENKYDKNKGKRHRVVFWFELEDKDSKGRRYVFPIWLTPTLRNSVSGGQSKLRQLAERLLKRDLSNDELTTPELFDIEGLVGKNCVLVLQHYTGDDGKERTRATSFLKSNKGKGLSVSDDYRQRGDDDDAVPF